MSLRNADDTLPKCVLSWAAIYIHLILIFRSHMLSKGRICWLRAHRNEQKLDYLWYIPSLSKTPSYFEVCSFSKWKMTLSSHTLKYPVWAFHFSTIKALVDTWYSLLQCKTSYQTQHQHYVGMFELNLKNMEHPRSSYLLTVSNIPMLIFLTETGGSRVCWKVYATTMEA